MRSLPEIPGEAYPQKNNSAEGYYQGFFVNDIVDTARLQYRLDGRLVGAYDHRYR